MNEILFRCSSLSHLMTEPRSKADKISDGTKTHCIDTYVSAVYGRKEEAHGKMLDKGNAREEDSLTLLSRVSRIVFNKNGERIKNQFIQGTPDTYIGNSIRTAEKIIDTKTSWSAHTFFRSANKELDKAYYWQIQGYMALTGARQGAIAFCLVNGTADAIVSEKRKAGYNYPGIDLNNPCQEYIDECRQIEINHIFDIEHFVKENPGFDFDNEIDKWGWDIPMKDRLHLFEIERNQDDIDRLYKRILDCREWMNEQLFKTNKIW